MEVEVLQTILKPIKEAVKCLETKSATLADCFLQLIRLSYAIKTLPESNSLFQQKCIEAFNKRWKQFDFRLYMLAYLLHPSYRGKGFRQSVYRKVVYWAIENVWMKMDGGKNSSAVLIAQLASYRNREAPYNDEYISTYYTVQSWWQLVEQEEGTNNFIQQLALKIFSITPHNSDCERIFSIMGWYMNKRRTKMSVDRLQNITKLHTYYVSNAKTELKYVAQDMNNMHDDEFHQLIRSSIQDIDDDDYDMDGEEDEEEDEDDDDDDLVDIEEDEKFGEENNNQLLQSENYFNLVSAELAELLKTQEPCVIIEPPVAEIDHGEKEFDLEALLDQHLSND